MKWPELFFMGRFFKKGFKYEVVLMNIFNEICLIHSSAIRNFFYNDGGGGKKKAIDIKMDSKKRVEERDELAQSLNRMKKTVLVKRKRYRRKTMMTNK